MNHYRAALAAEPSAATHNHLGVLLARSGDLDAAVESFRAAVSLDPEFTNAKTNLQQALALRNPR
jgi:lipoprotein NlpI